MKFGARDITENKRFAWLFLSFVFVPMALLVALNYRLYFTAAVHVRAVPVALALSIPLYLIFFSRANAQAKRLGLRLSFFLHFSVWISSALSVYAWSLLIYGLPVASPTRNLETRSFHVEKVTSCNTRCYWCDYYVQLADWTNQTNTQFCLPDNLHKSLHTGDSVFLDGYFSRNAVYVSNLRDS